MTYPNDAQFTLTILGASGETGKGLSQILAEHPSIRLLLTSRREDKDLQSLAEKWPEQVYYMSGIDFSNTNDAKQFADWISPLVVGKLSILSCLGYFNGFQKIEQISEQDANRVITSNYLANVFAFQALLPVLRIVGGGRFIVFGSNESEQCYPLMSAFTCAKEALRAFIRSIAHEYQREDISATCLAVSTIDTKTERRLRPHGDFANWLSMENLAEMVLWIITSPKGFFNGNSIRTFKYSQDYYGKSFYERIEHFEQ